MAALLPGAASDFSVVAHKGKLAARIGDRILADVGERTKFLKAHRPDARDLDLGTLLQASTRELARTLQGASLVVVRSQAIDALGEMDGGLMARQIMDTVIGNVVRALGKLSGLGIESFVISADHGHQFSRRKGEGMIMDKPGGEAIDLHRRCWAGRGGRASSACVRAVGGELGYDTDLDFIFPRGLAVFRCGGDLAYHHGGISLQEIVVPVVSLRIPSGAPAAAASSPIELHGLPESITNRIFSVRVRAATDLFSSEPLSVRLVLLGDGDVVGQAGMAEDDALDRVTGEVAVKPGTEISGGMILKRDACKKLRIVVQDPKTDAVLVQSADLTVTLGI
jgi:hypothetical protein